MKYLMTTHRWFQESEGFSVKEITATDLEHAELIAAKYEKDTSRTFSRARCDIIEICDNEYLAPRNLSLKERITGRFARQ